MKYGYVCTNYNNSAFTEEAILSLEAGSFPPTLIVVVDNCSEAAEAERIEAFQVGRPGVHLIRNSENVGYFPGLNLGIERLLALHPDVELLVIGNNDLEFPSDFGATLLARHDRLAVHPVIAPNIVTFDGVHQNPHALKPAGRFRELIYDIYYSNYLVAKLIETVAVKTRAVSQRRDALRHETEGHIFMGIGACYILTRTFIDNFDRLWSPTFLMGEEYFLAHQLAGQGYSIYYDPAIKVKHHDHASVKTVPSKTMWSLARQAHLVYRKYVKLFGRNPAFPVVRGR